ncbi:hypothetical protein C4D60_Mb08t23910 [Musa balbisiana]|uniref:NHL repeat-containing protein n=1 Tax=Musa balbisiana TaxID=52838 RepID=A0A4V4H959_MUSBA|nr:hypothetical protein C4D60_Mb08t23910 [Musa balbisiana]
MKFESGYTVETVFDGSKLGIEPHSVEVTQSGELLLLDSVNSNLYRISLPLSRCELISLPDFLWGLIGFLSDSRPKLIAGSPEGYVGHVDGRPREARMNHPKGFTVDGKGNIYVADAMNMAIRKISDTGATTTIAGGKGSRGGHADGPSEDAKFSTDFEVVYIASSCSLLVVDRGNSAIREIHLNFDDCAHQYETGLPLENTDEEGLFSSIGKLLSGTWSSTAAIFGAVFPVFRKKPKAVQYQQQQRVNAWPVPESFVIPDDEIPPPLETRTPTPHKTYAFMSKEPEKIHHIRHAPPYFSGWGTEAQQQQQQQVHQRQHLRQHRQYSSGPQTYYEQSCETTNEIVFGAVQESDSKRRSVEIKAVNYGDPIYEQYGMRNRKNFQASPTLTVFHGEFVSKAEVSEDMETFPFLLDHSQTFDTEKLSCLLPILSLLPSTASFPGELPLASVPLIPLPSPFLRAEQLLRATCNWASATTY